VKRKTATTSENKPIIVGNHGLFRHPTSNTKRKETIVRKEVIQEAVTLEEAIAAAATELGVSPDGLQYEVLQQPQKKVLGIFGGQTAIVKAWTETEEKKRADKKKKPQKKEKAEGTPADYTEAAARASAYLAELLAGMGAADAEMAVETTDTGVVLKLDGEQVGFAIGRRGDTLDALQ
jgi:spoIIIJ-associated protein